MHPWKVLFILSLLLLSSCGDEESIKPKGIDGTQEKKGTLQTEQFIDSYLKERKSGLIQTNLDKKEGSDLFLSESIGLWMEYATLKKDDALFDETFHTLQQTFITEEQRIRWKVTDQEKTSVNALIDDLRIMEALFQQGEQTGHEEYIEQAKQIGASIDIYQSQEGVFVDFYDPEHEVASEELTLSYLFLQGFESMKDYDIITSNQWESLYSFSKNIPLNEPFYPKTYHVTTNEFSYDQTVHMIDQLYIAYHMEPYHAHTDPLFSWLEEVYEEQGKIYGRYDAKTGEPAVDYESAAVYALALMFSLERGEWELASSLYDSMIAMRENDEEQTYIGGYVYENEAGEILTHSFDNLLPLLAERKYLDEQNIQ